MQAVNHYPHSHYLSPQENANTSPVESKGCWQSVQDRIKKLWNTVLDFFKKIFCCKSDYMKEIKVAAERYREKHPDWKNQDIKEMEETLQLLDPSRKMIDLCAKGLNDPSKQEECENKIRFIINGLPEGGIKNDCIDKLGKNGKDFLLALVNGAPARALVSKTALENMIEHETALGYWKF